MIYIGGIYFIVNKINGKKYIGSTKNFNGRFSKHRMDLRNNRHHSILLQNAWNKYGQDNFDFIKIEIINDFSTLKKIEQTYLLSEKCEYNMEQYVNKGFMGKKHSDETKKLISLKKKNTGTGINNPMFGKIKEQHHNYGKKMPQNGKRGINNHNFGKSSINRKIVLQYDLNGVLIKEFDSIKSASIELKIHKTYLSACCNGKFRKAKGFVFKFKSDS